jgi:hypothetical protein
VAVGTQGLKIRWVIVPPVTVFVVYIKLASVYWYEPTLLTFCAFMFGVWIDAVVIGSLPYSATAVSAGEWILFISQLHLGGTTDGADGGAFCLVMFS